MIPIRSHFQVCEKSASRRLTRTFHWLLLKLIISPLEFDKFEYAMLGGLLMKHMLNLDGGIYNKGNMGALWVEPRSV